MFLLFLQNETTPIITKNSTQVLEKMTSAIRKTVLANRYAWTTDQIEIVVKSVNQVNVTRTMTPVLLLDFLSRRICESFQELVDEMEAEDYLNFTVTASYKINPTANPLCCKYEIHKHIDE